MANYYIHSTEGNDANSGLSGSPWRTIGRANAHTLGPGDNLYLNRGGVWKEQLHIKWVGTAANKITISDYGSGALPKLHGWEVLTGWQSEGNGVYSVVQPGLFHSDAQGRVWGQVLVNGERKRMGRYPKYGVTNNYAYNGWHYMTSGSGAGSGTVYSNQLSGTPNFAGESSEIVLMLVDWVIHKCRITGHSGGEISYSGGINHYPTNPNKGFIIQNHPNCCTELGEWAYNPSTGKLFMYFGAENPASYNVQAASVRSNIRIGGQYIQAEHVIIENLDLEGAGQNNIAAAGHGVKDIEIRNVLASYASLHNFRSRTVDPETGEWAGRPQRFNIHDCDFRHANHCNISNDGSNDTYYDDNILESAGLDNGMLPLGDGSGHNLEHGQNYSPPYGLTVRRNRMKYAAGSGLNFQSHNVFINRNWIQDWCLMHDDNGGIYTYSWGSFLEGSNHKEGIYGPPWQNRVITENICYYSETDTPERSIGCHRFIMGIYFDEVSPNIICEHNTVINAPTGFFSHGASWFTFQYNNFFNCQHRVARWAEWPSPGSTGRVQNINFQHNVGYRWGLDVPLYFRCHHGKTTFNLDDWGTFNNNYWIHPEVDVQVVHQRGWDSPVYRTLQEHRSITGYELNSKIRPTTNPAGDIYYNDSHSAKYVDIGTNRIDVDGNALPDGLTLLQPFRSIIVLGGSPPETITAEYSVTQITEEGADDGIIEFFNPSGGSGDYEFSIDNESSWNTSTLYDGLAPGTYDLWVRDQNDTSLKANLGQVVLSEPSEPDPPPTEGEEPVIESVSTAVMTTQTSSLIIDKPSGTQEGDLLLAVVSGYNRNTNALNENPLPSGWTELFYDTTATGNYAHTESMVGIIVAGDSEPSNYTFNFSGAVVAAGKIFRISNIDPEDIIENSSHFMRDGHTADDVVASSVNAKKNNLLIFMGCGGKNHETAHPSIGVPSGMDDEGSLIGTKIDSYTDIRHFQRTASEIIEEDGTTGTRTASNSNAEHWHAHLIAINGKPGPDPVSASYSKTDVTTHGGSDGSITFSNPSGGGGQYEYSINGGANWQASSEFTGLEAGVYTLMVRDSEDTENETQVDIIEINQPAAPGEVYADFSYNPISSEGANDGSIIFYNPSGGSGNYEYSINNGNTWQINSEFTGLGVGTYDLRIRDENDTTNDAFIDQVILFDPPPGNYPELKGQILHENTTVSNQITIPATGIQEGEFLLALISGRRVNANLLNPNPADGWNIVFYDCNTEDPEGFGWGRQEALIAWIFAPASPPANYSFTFSGYCSLAGRIMRWGNVSQSNPIQASSHFMHPEWDRTPVEAPGIVAKALNTLVYFGCSGRGAEGVVPSIGVPSGMVNRDALTFEQFGTTTSTHTQRVATEERPTEGTTGARAGANSEGDSWQGHLLALNNDVDPPTGQQPLTAGTWQNEYGKLNVMFDEFFTYYGLTFIPYTEGDINDIIPKLNADFTAIFTAAGIGGQQTIIREYWEEIILKVNQMFNILYHEI